MTEDTRRLTRRGLYDLVWTKPVDTLAKELGISGRGLGKLCERHGVPVPPRGYWAKKSAGQKVKRAPLVELADAKTPDVILDLTFRTPASPAAGPNVTASPDPYRELFDRQWREIGPLIVPDQLRQPHPIIAAWLKQEETERQQAQHSPYGRRHFTAKFTTALARRRLRILNTLFRELERRGCKIEQDDPWRSGLGIRLGHDALKFSLEQRIRQVRRALTENERANSGSANQQWTQTREATGELVLKLDCHLPKGVAQSWQDKTEHPLEAQVQDILAGLLTAIACLRQRREEREEEERQRLKRQNEAQQRQAEQMAELSRKRGLRQRTKAWQIAADIRDYVVAVTNAVATGTIQAEAEELENWSSWALAHADEIDPLHSKAALETSLLWEEEQSSAPRYGAIADRRPSGDPDWFWGQRWWRKG
jgi:hypothetical protein